jgi:hypothetical protein
LRVPIHRRELELANVVSRGMRLGAVGRETIDDFS